MYFASHPIQRGFYFVLVNWKVSLWRDRISPNFTTAWRWERFASIIGVALVDEPAEFGFLIKR